MTGPRGPVLSETEGGPGPSAGVEVLPEMGNETRFPFGAPVASVARAIEARDHHGPEAAPESRGPT